MKQRTVSTTLVHVKYTSRKLQAALFANRNLFSVFHTCGVRIGSRFDEEGKFFDWWSQESRARFKTKSQGLVSKYANYSLPEGSVNGILTLGENIADCGGVKEAFSVRSVLEILLFNTDRQLTNERTQRLTGSLLD